MSLSATAGADVLAAVASAMPGAVVRMRVKTGAEVSAIRTGTSAQIEDGQYGRVDGASAVVRCAVSAMPAGVTLKDEDTIEIFEADQTWHKYRVNGLTTTMGMYRFTTADHLG